MDEHVHMHSLEVRRRKDNYLMLYGERVEDDQLNALIAALAPEHGNANIYVDDLLVEFDDDGSWHTSAMYGPASD